ncbi:MAG: TIM barrel protein [Burkholderiales bacterium]|jgi:hydroxypyruvate isomerase|uniref:hydroxypyruvate isomerase family protein n=1 Tax=Limnobacter sp. TaxID=2003368 RepID=UPI00392FA8AE|nr:TIM barrel protein [Burkholderiales bacterium]
MKLAANLSWLYTEFSFPDRLLACAQDGFKHAECMFPYDYSATLLREKALEAGVQWVLINAPPGDWSRGDRGLASSPARRDEFKRSIEQALNYATVLDVQKVHVLAGLVDLKDKHAMQSAWDCYAENLAWLADSTRGEPVSWLIEPINRFDVPGYLLAYQSEAHELLAGLNKPNLGVQMDLYHCLRTEGEVLNALQSYLPTGRVKHLQLAGVPHRNEPEASDYAPVYEHLKILGYKEFIGCEYRPRAGTRDGLGWIRSTGFSGTMESFET